VPYAADDSGGAYQAASFAVLQFKTAFLNTQITNHCAACNLSHKSFHFCPTKPSVISVTRPDPNPDLTHAPPLHHLNAPSWCQVFISTRHLSAIIIIRLSLLELECVYECAVSPDDLSFSLKPESMRYAGDGNEIRRERSGKSDHLYSENNNNNIIILQFIYLISFKLHKYSDSGAVDLFVTTPLYAKCFLNAQPGKLSRSCFGQASQQPLDRPRPLPALSTAPLKRPCFRFVRLENKNHRNTEDYRERINKIPNSTMNSE